MVGFVRNIYRQVFPILFGRIHLKCGYLIVLSNHRENTLSAVSVEIGFAGEKNTISILQNGMI